MLDIFVLAYCILCIMMARRFDVSESKVLWVMSSPSILIAALFPYHFNSGFGIQLLSNDYFEITNITYYWVVIIATSYFLAFLCSSLLLVNRSSFKVAEIGFIYVDSNILNRCFYILAFISFGALTVNLYRTGGIASMFSMEGRAYEALFGKYWIINYLYFMHIPALIIAAIKQAQSKLSFIDKAIVFFLAVGSMFHGIKFTFFDAVFIPFLFYVTLVGFDKVKIKFYALILLFIFFTSIYTLLVRGIGDDFNFLYFINYVIPNYYNLFYALEINNYPLAMPTRLIFSFYDFGIEQDLLVSGFILNDKYNMSTGFKNIIEAVGVVGIFIFYLVMNIIYIKVKPRGIFSCFVKSLVLFCYLMMFYSYYIGTKPKLIMILMVLWLLSLLLSKRHELGNRK